MQSFTPSITTAMTSERTTWCVTSDYHTHEHSYTPTTTFFLHWIAMSVSVWYYYTDVISNIYVIPCNNEALQNIMYQWYGQMLPGQMSPWQLQSLLDLQGNLPLKFHQNRVSNSWYIADIELVWFGWVVWWGGWVGVLTIFSKSKLQDMLKVFLLENKGKTWIYRLLFSLVPT